ncbi:hypothetical protein FORC13_p073 (plasmid) [Bacillus cereus]|nr:hypothetical protein FORC13_p073 [Bacillus cereus]
MLKTFKNNLFEVDAKLENEEVLFDVEQVAAYSSRRIVLRDGETCRMSLLDSI